MHKSRSYIYVEACDETSWWLSGVQFREFIQEYGPTNLLLLKNQFAGADRHPGTGLDYVTSHGLKDLCADDHYAYGDLVLLDLPEVSSLNGLPKQTVAELLYLAHAWAPISTPFFPQLGNEFAYLAHDDGWMTKVWFQRPAGFLAVLGGLIASRLGRRHRRRIQPLLTDIQGNLARWASGGLLIDLADSRKTDGELLVPLYLMPGAQAPFSQGGRGIDDLLDRMDDYKANAQITVLHYSRHQWFLEQR